MCLYFFTNFIIIIGDSKLWGKKGLDFILTLGYSSRPLIYNRNYKFF